MKFVAIYSAVIAATMAFAGSAQSATLIDRTTVGYYNKGIGQVLDGTNPYQGVHMFPKGDRVTKITVPASAEPDLSAASAMLSNWLIDPTDLGGTWSDSMVKIPRKWAAKTETAIVYALDAGLGGIANTVAKISVDNGAYLWLNGTFVGGMSNTGVKNRKMNFIVDLGSLGAGMNYLQILREDHGGSSKYDINVSGDYRNPAQLAETNPALAPVPLPASGLMLFAAAGGLAMVRRRKKA